MKNDYQESQLNFNFLSYKNFLPEENKKDFEKSDILVIFVNPKSGSQRGKKICNLSEEFRNEHFPNFNILNFPQKNTKKLISSEFDSTKNFTIVVFNVVKSEELKQGNKFIKDYLDFFPKNKIKVLIAGGDGTVLSFVSELGNICNLQKIIFGNLPMGTGNDLSNTLNFGYDIKINNIFNLHKLLYSYIIAKETKIDIWKVSVEMNDDNGFIQEIKNGKIEDKKDNNGNLIKKFNRSFINYTSLGFDAKCGFSFEQKRSSSRYINKLIYAYEAGIRIATFEKQPNFAEIIEGLYIGENIYNSKKDFFSHHKFSTDTESTSDKTSYDGKDFSEIKYEKIPFNGYFMNLVVQNIFHYFGGVKNIWKNIPIKNLSGEELRSFKDRIEQNYNDKKLEFFTFDSPVKMGMENVFGGNAKRLNQGFGPWLMKFKNDIQYENSLSNLYLNVDGEFFRLIKPKQIEIYLDNDINEGQINILKHF
jgi:hypothetical protein